MRNCQRCRPCRPSHGCGCNHGNQGGGSGCGVETIVEPTVHCRINDRHHHQRVRHIVPIVYHQAHHHHKHHEYEVRRKFTQEHRHHEHGRFDGDWCETDRGNVGGQGGSCGSGGHGQAQESFEQTNDFGCDGMFS